VNVQLRRPTESDRARLADLAARQQGRPERHVAYLGVTAESIAAEMIAEDDDWTLAASMAERDGRPVGWLMGSFDAGMRRVWWFGPFVDVDDDEWAALAHDLYGPARAALPLDEVEEEFAPDSRNVVLIRWATDLGFDVDPGSAVLSLTDPLDGPSVPIRQARPGDAAAIAPLHDELFPGAHTTGAALVDAADDRHIRLVAEPRGEFAGYVAVELQPDGSGYVDFLGVAPAHRRRGLGTELVRAGVAALRERGAGDVHLTVREADHGARALYTGLGFVEERVITPVRRGFRQP
jgi:ribosomal protein S18 acetylase RimI-like enzyme